MTHELAPLSRKERAELQGYVSASTVAGRVALFLAGVALVGGCFRRIERLAAPAGGPRLYWLVPTAAFAVWLAIRSRRWTGGRALRRGIIEDLRIGRARVHRLEVDEAISVREREDEGPTFFLKLRTGEVVAFAGQYLEPYVRRGFPWREFEVREGAASGRFLGLRASGERIRPSLVRDALSWQEIQALGIVSEPWRVLDVPFEALRLTGREDRWQT